MEQKISYIIFSILKFIDLVLNKITNRSFLRWFPYFIQNKSYKSILIDGKKVNFYCPNHLLEWRIETFFTKEPETLEWINKFKEKNKIIFWDIGANVGLYSIYAALKHKNCQVISFEPSTSNLRILSRNIFINNLVNKINIISNPLQNVSNQNKFLSMNETEFIEGHALNSFGNNLNFEGKKFSPKMSYNILGTSINFLLDNNFLEIPDYIKIDVDGIEHLILEGGGKYLKNKEVKSVIIEVNENYELQFKSIMDLMKEFNFKLNEKKQREEYSKLIIQDQFSKTYNYIFEKL